MRAVAKIHDNVSITIVMYKRGTPSPATGAMLSVRAVRSKEKQKIRKNKVKVQNMQTCWEVHA